MDRHRNNFDALRLLLALLVVVSHSYLLVGPFEPLSYLTGGQLYGGGVAVDAFFVLSGYLITKSWLRSRGQLDYFRKRILRIYPGYLAAVCFSILVIGPLAAKSAMSYFAELRPLGAAYDALLLQGTLAPKVFADQRFSYMNGSLWTIYYEFMCYIAVAILGGCGALRKFGWRVPGAIFLAAWLLALVDYHLLATPIWLATDSARHWARFSAYFSIGSLFSFAPPTLTKSARLALLSCAVLFVGCMLACLDIVMPCAGAYLILWAACWQPAGGRVPRPAVDISYGVYLYAYPVQQLLIHCGVKSPGILCLIALPSSLLMGWSSWHWVEKHFLLSKPRVPSA